MEAFFERSGENRYRATEYSIGPWGPDSLHGGPPAALLGTAIEGAASDTPKKVARIAYDILKPVPVGVLEVNFEVIRPGKKVDLVEATLLADDVAVMRASAWRILTTEIDLPNKAPATTRPSPLDAQPKPTFPPPTERNYLTAMEWRFVEGEFLAPGSAIAWLRMRHPLVSGEENSPLTRVLTAVDSASGVSAALEPWKWLFVNVDLIVNLNRYPQGEWIGLDATTTLDPSGTGLARSTIFDETGDIGASAQSLFIAPR